MGIYSSPACVSRLPNLRQNAALIFQSGQCRPTSGGVIFGWDFHEYSNPKTIPPGLADAAARANYESSAPDPNHLRHSSGSGQRLWAWGCFSHPRVGRKSVLHLLHVLHPGINSSLHPGPLAEQGGDGDAVRVENDAQSLANGLNCLPGHRERALLSTQEAITRSRRRPFSTQPMKVERTKRS